jgi:ribonuclease P protein component
MELTVASGDGDRSHRRPDQGWRPEHRVRRRLDYLRCYRSGRRVDAAGLRLYLAPGETDGPRFGITASRKLGKAVVRQRTRRRVREILRRWPQRRSLPPVDLVVHLEPGAAQLSFAELRRSLEGALGRAAAGGGQRTGSRRDPGRRGSGRRRGRQ